MKHIVMVASENGALRGGKVGGVADVIRDLPRALAALDCRVTVIIPSYGFLHTQNPSTADSQIVFPFGGKQQRGVFWKVNADPDRPNITHYLFEHPELRGEPIYYNDPSGTPFLRDATKYALFCSATGKFLQTLTEPYVLHLHDWHAATILLLAQLHPEFTALRSVQTAYTIHNLSIQGTRPMQDDPSSLKAWFPELFRKRKWISMWRDERYEDDCYTPMAAGIRFANKVNTVSPTYAQEILKPSVPSIGAFRGEGLEPLLKIAAEEHRLSGILNGCDYPPSTQRSRLSFDELRLSIERAITAKTDLLPVSMSPAEKALESWGNEAPSMVLTCVTRVVEQKVRLLFERGTDGRPVIEHLHEMLVARNGLFILLGSGTPDYETRVRRYFAGKKHFLYIHGYYEDISNLLYRNGNLFLMPSLFEPCGISQMMAMREGQPCIVHFVGGLRDTVINMETGFGFRGRTFREMADGFTEALRKAFDIYYGNRSLWETIAKRAGEARFTWDTSAKLYLKDVYTL